MQHKKTIILLVLGALAVTMSFGALAYRSVFAAAPTVSTDTITSTGITTSTGTTIPPGAGMNRSKSPLGGYSNEDLATALGITTDELTAAYQNAYAAALKDAVTQGLITQAQADELTSTGSVFPFGNHWDGWLKENGLDFTTYLTDALGITVDELKAAYQTAYNANIDQAVADGNLTQDQADLMEGRYALYNDSTFQSSMQSAFTSAVNQAVTSGVITQTQADKILSNNNGLFTPGPDGFGGPGGPHGHGGGHMNNDDTPVSP